MAKVKSKKLELEGKSSKNKNSVKSKKRLKKRSEFVTVSMTLPEEIYIALKQWAKEDIRSLSQEARYFMEIGMQIVQQQMDSTTEVEVEEQAPAIGFMVDKEDDEDWDDEE